MTDYHVTLKIRQGRMKAAMEVMGIQTAAELSRRSGVCQVVVGRLLNFKDSPRRKDGDWRKVTLRICKVLGSEPEELFPSHLQHEVLTNEVTGYIERQQLEGVVQRQLNPREELEQKETSEIIEQAMDKLTPLQQTALVGRYWDEETYKKLGQRNDRTLERMRQNDHAGRHKLARNPRVLHLAEEVLNLES